MNTLYGERGQGLRERLGDSILVRFDPRADLEVGSEAIGDWLNHSVDFVADAFEGDDARTVGRALGELSNESPSLNRHRQA